MRAIPCPYFKPQVANSSSNATPTPLADEKRRAKACFAHIAFPYPPPPPVRIVHDTAAASSLWRQRERLGDLEAYEAPRKTDRAQWADDTAGAMRGTEALIDALGENNPILRDMLQTAKQEIYAAGVENAVKDPEAAAAYAAATTSPATAAAAAATAAATGTGGYGRRLMQRIEYNVRMTEALITAEIMEFYGKGGIPGVSAASCEALCEGTAQMDDVHPTAICKAFAFKRAAPFSYVDKTGWCYLLQNSGACKIQDFAVELYTRQIESERQCSATAPGLDSAPPPPPLNAAPTPPLTTHPPTSPTPWQIRCASACPARATTRACSRTPMRPRWPRSCPTTTTRRPARAGCRCPARSWRR